MVVSKCMLFSGGGGGFTSMLFHTEAELLMEQRWRINCAVKVYFNNNHFTCVAGYQQHLLHVLQNV